MKVVFLVLVFLCSSGSLVHALFERDRATALAQCGDWEAANKMVQPLIVHDDANPELLYDAGVMSYNTGAFGEAQAYFQKVVNNTMSADQLKEQAYFNLGNTAVALNQLEQAIEHYESALKLNPDNEWAKHNLQRVKEMLEQQQQEKQKKEQEQQQQQQQKQEEQKQQEQQSGTQQGQNQNDTQQQNNDTSNEQKQDANQDQQNQSDHLDQRE